MDEKSPYPPDMPQPMEMGRANRDRGPDRKRTKELLSLAEGIAVQVGELTHPRERCLLRQMVEMFLNVG